MWVAHLIGVILLAPPLLAGAGKGWAAVLVMAAGYFQTVFFLNCPPPCGCNRVRHRMYVSRLPHRCPHCGEFIW